MRQLRPLSLARRKETHLKYAVEVKIPRSTPMMGLLEPILERVVYEDIPFNLAALKQRVEDIKLQRRIAELEEQGVAPTAPLRRVAGPAVPAVQSSPEPGTCSAAAVGLTILYKPSLQNISTMHAPRTKLVGCLVLYR